MVKNPSASAGEVRTMVSIPGSGRSPGGMTTHSSALAWRIPWTEKPGIGYIVSQRVKSTEATSAHTRGNPESLARLQVLRGAALSTGL